MGKVVANGRTYATINEALRAGCNSITLGPGVYKESINMTLIHSNNQNPCYSLLIQGENQADVVIDGEIDAVGHQVQVTISNLTVQNGGIRCGADRWTETLIKNCAITNCEKGIVLACSSRVDTNAAVKFAYDVEDCVITNCKTGVFVLENGDWLYGESHCVVSRTDIKNCETGVEAVSHGCITLESCDIANAKSSGVSVDDTSCANMDGCDISDNSEYGVEISESSIRKTPGTFQINMKDCRINRNGLAGIRLPSSNKRKVSLDGCDLTENKKGPFDGSSDGHEIKDTKTGKGFLSSLFGS